MKVRRIKKGDVKSVASLVADTFKEFCSDDTTKKGLNFYLECHSVNKPEGELWKMYGSEISFVAVENSKIIGIAKGSRGHLGNLFVAEKFHGEGIGKRLMDVFEKKSYRLGVSDIKIRASLYSVPFYSSRGYRKTTGIREVHGIRFQPMRKRLDG